MGAIARQLRGSVDAFRGVIGNRALRRLEGAWAAATFAYSGLNVVVMVYGYEHGGASAVGVMALLRVLPGALVSPLTSVLADRYRRERVLLVANVLRTGFVAVAAAIAIGSGPPWVIYVLTALTGIAGSNFRPAQAALAPQLARSPEELTAANVAASTIQAMGLLVAPGIAGAVVAATGTGAGFVLVTSLFALSTAFVLLVRPAEAAVARPQTGERVRTELVAGFRAISSEPGLRLVLALIGVQTFVAGALAVMNVVIAIELLQLGAGGVGYLNSAIGVGGLIGSVAAAALVGRARLAPPFVLGIFVWSMPLVLLAAMPHAAVAVIGWGVIGVANMLSDVAGFTLVQRTTPDAVLARVFGVLEMTMYSAMALGSITAPAVLAWIGTRGTLVAFGLVLPVCALVFGARVLALDRVAEVPGEPLQLLRAIPMFAALPATTLEQLAALLEPLALEEGAAAFVQGDTGDRFYVVARGRLEVLVDGRPVRELRPGDHFGEIALLRDVPRTASVIAGTRAELLALGRDEFVDAIAGHYASARAADATIAERLGVVGVG